ncbi:DUF455 family protein [Simkania sp.]|uniref:DUF455 family protein n=1 Tax=Simkania sp. TaxID=34094 RepID=UPI003B52EFC0
MNPPKVAQSSETIELRDWAIRILSADTLEEKLFTPQQLTDHDPGLPMIWNEPVRPVGMRFRRRSKEEKLPPFHEHENSDKRAVCLHRFAGHELLAVEIMAYALLRFPQAPSSFRRGVANTLKEEQEHVRLYIKELSRLGVCFGDLPLYRHFWCHTPYLTTPISYVSVMSLTFEMANLDFAPMYGHSFERSGDSDAAKLMARILKDEIAHVAFGWGWLKRMKEHGVTEWNAWQEALSPLLTPKRARGFMLHENHRLQAGVSQAWVNNLKNL